MLYWTARKRLVCNVARANVNLTTNLLVTVTYDYSSRRTPTEFHPNIQYVSEKHAKFGEL